jgi:hypothetical protein
MSRTVQSINNGWSIVDNTLIMYFLMMYFLTHPQAECATKSQTKGVCQQLPNVTLAVVKVYGNDGTITNYAWAAPRQILLSRVRDLPENCLGDMAFNVAGQNVHGAGQTESWNWDKLRWDCNLETVSEEGRGRQGSGGQGGQGSFFCSLFCTDIMDSGGSSRVKAKRPVPWVEK